MTDIPKPEGKGEEDRKAAIVKAGRECLSVAADADSRNREAALDDLKNLVGWQWPEEERTQREEVEGRPCLTVNLLTQFVKQVTGDLRRLNPAARVVAADSDAKPHVAEIIEGLVRAIEQDSDAASIYEGSAESAAQCGQGAFRILTDYETEDSFDQIIRMERVHNPFAVYWDPMAREVTREDARWCLVVEDIDGDEFKRLYPEASTIDVETDHVDPGMAHWAHGDTVRVAEYFWIEPEEVTLSLMKDGTVVEGAQKGAVRTRRTTRNKVMWAKISGKDVLEGPQEFPSRYIPVVAVMGEELHVGSEVVRSSVIRHAKDPQRLYNYAISTNAEITALQPKAPYIGTAKQFAGFESLWATANEANRPYLPYNPDEKAPGAPQRQMPPTPSPAHLEMMQRAQMDMKATTGIYDSALGAKSNESSGVAIRQRQIESDVGNSIYADNLSKSIRHAGRILVDMIPRIYDTPRTIRILGSDAQEKLVQVNSPQIDPSQDMQQVPVDLTVGRYDVRIKVGPSYTTRRQESAEGMEAMMQANPAIGQAIADLYVKAQDWPEAERISERLKRMVPPQLLGPEEMSPEEQQAAAMQAQQAQAEQARQAQMQEIAMQADLRVKAATAAEKEAKAATAGVEAQAAMMEAQRPEAQASPEMMMAELQQAVAKIQETFARVGLLQAQTEKTRAETAQTGTETALAVAGALMPPVVAGPPTRAPEPPGL